MKKIMLLFLLLFSFEVIFSMTTEDLLNLSNLPQTLEKSWEELLDVLKEEPETPGITKVGEIIASKRSLYSEYIMYSFSKNIVEEDLESFCVNLGVMSSDFRTRAEDIDNILIVFPQIKTIINKSFETGVFEKIYIKYLYRISGLKEHISPSTFDPFLKFSFYKSLSNPTFLDEDMKFFILNFVPKSIQRNLNEIIKSSRFLLQEEDFPGAYNYLSFLNDNYIIDSDNLKILSKLENYFKVKNIMLSLSREVFEFEKNECEKFVNEIFEITKEYINIDISKGALKDLLYVIYETLNIKLENINEKCFVKNFDLAEYDLKDKDLLAKLKKLHDNIEQKIMKVEEIDTNISKPASKVIENKVESNKITKIWVWVLLFIFGFVLFIYIFIFIYPTYSKVDFLCGIGFGGLAVKLSEKMIMKNPRDYKAYLALAKAYESISDYEKSIMAYRNATKIKEKEDKY